MVAMYSQEGVQKGLSGSRPGEISHRQRKSARMTGVARRMRRRSRRLEGNTAMAVELAELIAQLRTDLAEAMRAGADSELRFELGPVELELTVALAKSSGANGKVRFWVVEANADANAASTTTQRIKLTLDPRRADRLDSRPYVSGVAEQGER
jgi:hypothetical protein